MTRRHRLNDDGSEDSPLIGQTDGDLDPDASRSRPPRAQVRARVRRVRVRLTEEDDRRICRKTDRAILTILVWVYFLQILDKTTLSFGATYGLREDTRLSPGQYSIVGAIGPVAQLLWQPFSSILIVKVPHRVLMPALCLGWGLAQTAMAGCRSFGQLMVTRFLLGLFEAGCLPLFSVITSQWYRRAEQPMRIAAWYSTNGAATIVAAGISYMLSGLKTEILKEWQILFLAVGLLTVASAPLVYWNLDNDIPSARFLTEKEKPQAVERLRANRTGTGTGTPEFQWRHISEMALEPKTYLWIAMTMLLNIGTSVTSIFGPLIISGFGFDKYTTSLLNIPFGAFQLVLILFASFLAQRARLKGAVLAAFMVPVVAGLVVLNSSRGGEDVVGMAQAAAAPLFGFYLLAFTFGGNPLIVTWIVGNTAGTTKRSAMMSVYNAASSIGNIIGPLLFNDRDAPLYKPGLHACLAIFLGLVGVVLMQWANLVLLNRRQEARRVKNGKKAKVVDVSMQDHFHGALEAESEDENDDDDDDEEEVEEEQTGILDMTDGDNDEFVYIY